MTTILQFAVAALYLVGAVFNATYTLRHPKSFYGGFAEGAWFDPAPILIRRWVIPNGRVFTIALIAFQLGVATLILAGGDLAPVGMVAAAGFSLGAALASSPVGTVGNLALAALQATLAAAY